MNAIKVRATPIRFCIVCAWVAVVAYSSVTYAATNSTASLEAQMQALQRQIDDLKARVGVLEHVVAATPTVTTPVLKPKPQAEAARPQAKAQNGPTLRHRWHSIKREMSEAQVASLLGKPQRILTLNGEPVWYYRYRGIGSGSVAFDRDGRVIDWQDPPLSVWW